MTSSNTERDGLDRLFRPETVAVVGASASPEKAGYKLVEAALGSGRTVFPVNPRADRILDLPVYPDLASLPQAPDLVMMGIPAGASPAALRAAADRGAGAAIIVSGGFGETESGGDLQADLAAICRDTGIRLLGPNTSGFVAPADNMLGTFLPEGRALKPGNVAIVAQSGGVNLAVAFSALEEDIGLALAVGLGNAVDIRAADMVAYLGARDDVDVVILHLEGVVDGRRLHDAIAAAADSTAIVALPIGRTDVGAFAKSHTGNLMGDFALTRAGLEAAGAVVVDTTAEALDAARALRRCRLAPTPDPGVGLLTGQAGPGLIIADFLKLRGISMPVVSAETEAKIASLLPPMTYMKNPVDTGRPGETYGDVLKSLAGDPSIDAVLAYALYETGAMDPVAALTQPGLAAPILYGTGGAEGDVAPVVARTEAAGVPSYRSPERAASGLAALARDAQAQWRRRERAAHTAADAGPALPEGPLDEAAAKRIVADLGIRIPEGVACPDRSAARAAFDSLAKPVAVKILDAAVAHKTEAGGVHLGIGTPEHLADALDRIDAGAGGGHGYLIEEMAPSGVDLILGGRHDGSWGAAVLIGLGGTAAEAMGDVAVCLAPLGAADAEAMLAALRGGKMLDGWRGAPPCDRGAVINAIVAMGDFLAAHPTVSEVDINPLRATPDGVIALDALIVVG